VPAKHNLGALVGAAGEEIVPPGTLRRGQGLAGLFSTPDPAPITPQAALSTSPSAAAGPKALPVRKVASYRIEPELARRVKIYAAIHDLNDYEVVEAALRAYLAGRE
jgi:hypothetical protein